MDNFVLKIEADANLPAISSNESAISTKRKLAQEIAQSSGAKKRIKSEANSENVFEITYVPAESIYQPARHELTDSMESWQDPTTWNGINASGGMYAEDAAASSTMRDTSGRTSIRPKATTNRKQYETLITMLNENPDFAQGFTKNSKNEAISFWESVSQQLNAHGPPIRDATAWRKVFLDYKGYIKRKLLQNKIERNTFSCVPASKMVTFNDLEEAVIKLAGLDACIADPVGLNSYAQSVTIEDSSESRADATENIMCMPTSAPLVTEAEAEASPLETEQQPATNRSLADGTELQFECNEKPSKFYEAQQKLNKDISLNLRRLNKLTEKLYDVQKEQLEETRRHNQVKESLMRRSFELKLRSLQLKEMKANNGYF